MCKTWTEGRSQKKGKRRRVGPDDDPKDFQITNGPQVLKRRFVQQCQNIFRRFTTWLLSSFASQKRGRHRSQRLSIDASLKIAISQTGFSRLSTIFFNFQKSNISNPSVNQPLFLMKHLKFGVKKISIFLLCLLKELIHRRR